MNNERLIGVIDKMIKPAHQSDGVFICDTGIDAAPVYFKENQTLFYIGRLTNAIGKHLRPMESEFGVLPLPKYNEEQKDYVTYIHTSATFTCVPKTVSADRISLVDAVLEGWCAEGYRTVITPFIDTAMKLKYSRDSFSGQGIDMVFKGAAIDFPELNTVATADIYYKAISTSINEGSNVFSSVYASSIQATQNTLDEYIRGELNADN